MTPELSRGVRGFVPRRTEQDERIPQLDFVGPGPAAGTPLFLDLRPASLFARGFIPGSINVPTADCLHTFGELPEFAGRPCYVIAASPVQRHAARNTFGHHRGIRVAGWLTPDVIREWSRKRGELMCFEEVAADTLAVRIASWKTVVLDIRNSSSFEAGHVPHALHITPDILSGSLTGLPSETSLSLLCDSGARAGFAASLLCRMGYTNIAIVRGGFQAYARLGLPIVRRSAVVVN